MGSASDSYKSIQTKTQYKTSLSIIDKVPQYDHRYCQWFVERQRRPNGGPTL